MFNVSFPIPETDDTVSRPIAFALIEQIKDITNIQKDADVTYIGQGGSRKHFQTTTDPAGAPVKLSGDRQVIVEIEEIPSQSTFANETVFQQNQLVDFFDKALGLYVKPTYAGFDFVLTFTYRTPSRAEAIRWRNDVRSRHSQLRAVNMHDVGYIYQLTPRVMELIAHLHSLKEKVAPEGLEFLEYFNRHISKRAVQYTDVVGKNPAVFFKEVGTRIQGTFDFTYEPRKQERSEGLGWEVQFTYTAELSMPVAWAVTYPIIVHNQPISKEWIPNKVDDQYERKRAQGLVLSALDYMEAPNYNARSYSERPSVRYPDFDHWVPNQNPPDHRHVASWLLGLRPTPLSNPQETVLLNFNHLTNIYIHPEILRWIKEVEYKYIHLPFISAVQFHLYRNEAIMSSLDYYVKANGDIILKGTPDLRKRYRVVFSIVDKIRNIDRDSLLRLKEYPEAMRLILKMTNTVSGEIFNLLPWVDIREFAKDVPQAGTTEKAALDNIVSRKTVMIAGVDAVAIDRMDDNPNDNFLLRYNV